MQVVIRTEAHPDIGLGHLMRMLALAEWLRFHDVNSALVLTRFTDTKFTNAFAEDLKNRAAGKNIALHWVPLRDDPTDAADLAGQFCNVDWFILDSYNLGQAWLLTMTDKGRQVCVLDDHPKLHRSAQLVVDPTLFSKRDQTGNTRCFAGANYFLAAPQLARHHFILDPEAAAHAPEVRRWFVSFGGTDVQRMLPHTLRTLGNFLSTDAQVDIGINPSVAHLEEIRAACRQLPVASRLLHESAQIIQALADCDFAIGAAGGMTLERALLGIPSLATQVADNQAEIYRQLGAERLSYTLEPEAFTGGGALREKLVEILSQKTAWPQMSRNSLALSQGLGAGWVAQYLSRNKHANIYLRYPSEDFRERLFVWQSTPTVRQYSRNPVAPLWLEHCAWYAKRRAVHNSVMAEIVYQDCSVGMLRLDHKNSDPLQFEASILIAPDYHGRGIAPMALRLARRLVPFGEFIAYIQPENRASLRAFAAAGYQPTSQPDYFRREAIHENSY